jgi:hypothetical protein
MLAVAGKEELINGARDSRVVVHFVVRVAHFLSFTASKKTELHQTQCTRKP